MATGLMADAANERSVRLRVVVRHPLVADGQTVFGLQDKSGAVEDGSPGADDSRVFECEVRAAPSADGSRLNLLGAFTHGTPTSRHLYLSRGRRGSATGWITRIKVPLSSITWAMIDRAQVGSLEADVDGRRSGTVPAEWRMV